MKFKEYFARYSYDGVKMLLTQIVMALFGASVTIAVSAAFGGPGNAVMLVAGAGSSFFYLFMLYNTAWRMGDMDRSTIAMGNLPYKPLTGLWVSLVANIPNLVIAVVGLVLTLTKGEMGVIPLIGGLFNAAYMGFMSYEFAIAENVTVQLNGYWWTYAVFTLPALAVSTFAYIMGSKGKMLTKLNAYQAPASDRPTRAELKKRERENREKNQ